MKERRKSKVYWVGTELLVSQYKLHNGTIKGSDIGNKEEIAKVRTAYEVFGGEIQIYERIR